MTDSAVTYGAPASALADLDPAMRILVVAKASSALADPVRLQIVRLLADDGEATVGELTDALPVSQPRVSVHLRCLTDCGFTAVRRQGRRSYYRLAGPHVAELVDTLHRHAETALPGLLACLDCGPRSDAGCC